MTAFIETESTYSKGAWSNVREEGTKVKSILKYFIAGQTLRGKVEIGAIGSGKLIVSMSSLHQLIEPEP
ncbi:MAG: hypothetical protein Ct9H300mP6_18750 [Gammaproteobacteria bacterium]|nr:MAG: hypothetical protein Ct9H300mP6_18750 [Gammaproteobacteria bacterium]